MPDNRSEPLEFRDEPGASRSAWIALGLAVLLLAWMGSGLLFPSEQPLDPDAALPDAGDPVVVAVRPSAAELVTETLTAEGQARPDRLTAILAETTGEVAEIRVDAGAAVSEGETLATLSAERQRAALEQARSELRRAEEELGQAETLSADGAVPADLVSERRTAAAGARARVTEAENALDDAIVRAPFAGRLESFDLDAGEFVQAGSAVGTLIDADPLSVVIQVPQQALADIEVGQPAEVSFITGEVRDGTVAFVGLNADEATRTFRVEVEVPNTEDPLPAGLSARVTIPVGQTQAHFLSPAILSLAEDGTLGVKIVNDTGDVEFHAIEIVRAQVDGVWVSGLPDTARIITIGQGFVNDGEAVEARPEEAIALPTAGS